MHSVDPVQRQVLDAECKTKAALAGRCTHHTTGFVQQIKMWTIECKVPNVNRYQPARLKPSHRKLSALASDWFPWQRQVSSVPFYIFQWCGHNQVFLPLLIHSNTTILWTQTSFSCHFLDISLPPSYGHIQVSVWVDKSKFGMIDPQ